MCFLNIFFQDFKKTTKVTWLAEAEKAPFVPAVLVYFDNLISKAILGKDEDFKNFINKKSRVGICSIDVTSWLVCFIRIN